MDAKFGVGGEREAQPAPWGHLSSLSSRLDGEESSVVTEAEVTLTDGGMSVVTVTGGRGYGCGEGDGGTRVWVWWMVWGHWHM